ncbi:atypical abc1 abc1-b kinase [Paramyrothecium foliicola]|nr:atypical abc1 abc1-b kinase [Paramyrothecium foliicola]
MSYRNMLGVSRAARAPLRCRVPSCHVAPRLSFERRMQTSGPFQPMRPPTPDELGAPKAANQYKRGRKWVRRLALVGGIGGAIYLYDREVYASGLGRSLRTFGTGLLAALDYSVNFRPEPWTGGTIQDLHLRNAERLSTLLHANGGLYLKIGQAIAMQSAVLPPEFQKMFGRMFDDAPQDEWKDIEKVIKDEFGKSVEEVFGVSFTGQPGKGLMERRARASASVAQVHWARLPDGREVAIKIQKREIAKQISWDLWAFKTVTWIYSKWFDLPLYNLVPFIAERLELETDFVNEAKNSEAMRQLVNSEPKLRGKVYIPTVYPEFNTRRVLVTEWIEGVRLWDKQVITSRWLGGHGKGSPGAGGILPPIDMDAARHELRTQPYQAKLKPERQEWKGRRGQGGLGLSTKDVASTLIELYSASMFKFGVVHCDPHPGNIFIRRLPTGKSELVLIDHGLYVYMTPSFRRQYAEFWKSLLSFDNESLRSVAAEWGIQANYEVFASATQLRPYEGSEHSIINEMKELERKGVPASERHFLMQQRMKQAIRDILADQDKFPKELLFVGRALRILQANNSYFGSPVNRIKIMGNWASRSLFEDAKLPLPQRARNWWRHIIFKVVLAVTDVAFYVLRVRQWFGKGGGLEEELEQRLQSAAGDFGIELQQDVFRG